MSASNLSTTSASNRTRPRSPRRALLAAGVTAVATVALGVPAAVGAPTAPVAPIAPVGDLAVHRWAAPLADLQPAVDGPFDSARGRLVMISHRGSTTAVFSLTGVSAAAVGHTFGAHLHTGPCVAGNGAAAGPHYNDSTVHGVVPPVVGPSTEVWLDVTIGPDGSAVAVARVPFVPLPGDRSVVVHAQATDDHGTAGARLACLPVSWS